MPSMVVISLYSGTRFIFLVQARTTSPFRMMEQAPHTPVPHPIFTPVRPMRRRTSARVSFSGSQVTNLSTPLMFKLNAPASCRLPFYLTDLFYPHFGCQYIAPIGYMSEHLPAGL